jgi:hypothetical protein
MRYQQPPDDRAAAPTGPPPGWYPAPGGLQLLRWWDGTRWGPQTQPLPGYQQASQPQYGDASAGYDAFGQQSAGRHAQLGGVQGGATYPPHTASGAYRASIPAAQPQQPNPYQPQLPQDLRQPAGLPQQQAQAVGRQPQPRRAPQRAGKRARNVLIGLGALTGIIVGIVAANTHGSSSSGNPAAAAAAASTPAPANSAASASCADQVNSWRGQGGGSQMSAVENDLDNFQKAGQDLVSDLNAGNDASADEAALQTAAASLQSDAQAAAANLPPSCVPNLRQDYGAAMTDYSKAAIDCEQSISELTNGDAAVATDDINASGALLGAGNGKVDAAAADIKSFG